MLQHLDSKCEGTILIPVPVLQQPIVVVVLQCLSLLATPERQPALLALNVIFAWLSLHQQSQTWWRQIANPTYYPFDLAYLNSASPVLYCNLLLKPLLPD